MSVEHLGAEDEELAELRWGDGSLCAWCGESEAGVRSGLQARVLMRVWQALLREGMQPVRVGREYCALIHEFLPATAAGLGFPFEMAERSVVEELLEVCPPALCEHCELDPAEVERALVREAVGKVLVEPLRYGRKLEEVVKTVLARVKELSPGLVRCATGTQLGRMLGYKVKAERAGVSALTRRVLNAPVEASTGHAARFGRQKTPGMRERCSKAQQGNGNREHGELRALVARVMGKAEV